MTPLLFDVGGSAQLAARIAKRLGTGLAPIEQRRFPHGEAYVRLTGPVAGDVVFVASLARGADVACRCWLPPTRRGRRARDGSPSWRPISPMRKAFHQGEPVTSRTCARLLSGAFDWLATVDPHLHRFTALGGSIRSRRSR